MDIQTIEEQPKKYYQKQSGLQLGQGLSELGKQVGLQAYQMYQEEKRKQQQVELNNNLLQATTEGTKVYEDYKIKNELTPNQKDNIEKLYSDIDLIGENFMNSLPSSQKNEAKRQLDTYKAKLKSDRELWAFQQNYKNGVNSLQTQIKNLNNQSVSFGMTGDYSKAIEQFGINGETIKKNAALIMGEEKSNQLVSNLDKDYWTSYFAGALQTQPEQVLANIDEPLIISKLGTETTTQFRNVAKERIKQLRDYNSQKEIAGLMLKERDIMNEIYNGNGVDYITLNNFFEENNVNNHTKSIILKAAGFKESNVNSKDSEKITTTDKVEARLELETKLLEIEQNPRRYTASDLKDIQDKIYQYGDEGKLTQAQTFDLINRLSPYNAEIMLYDSQASFNNVPSREDKYAKQLLTNKVFTNSIKQYMKTDRKGNIVEGDKKNIYDNKAIIENNLAVSQFTVSALNTYQKKKTEYLLKAAEQEGKELQPYEATGFYQAGKPKPSTYYNYLSDDKFNKITKQAYEDTIKEISSDVGIDITNKTPFELEQEISGYIADKINNINNAAIDEYINTMKSINYVNGYVNSLLKNNNN